MHGVGCNWVNRPADLAVKKRNADRSDDFLRILTDPSPCDEATWRPLELQSILEHQMATSLASELTRFAEVASRPPDDIHVAIAGSGHVTFADVIAHSRPDPGVLRLVKEFAKSSMSIEEEGHLPKDVRRTIYVLAILRGVAIPHARITTLDKVSVIREARRCLTFAWLSENWCAVIRGGISNCERAD
jgi:hypothetical protein